MTLQQIISELADIGYSQAAIAKEIGSSQPTVNRAANGADIRFSTGRAIEQLYKSKMPEGTNPQSCATLNQMML